MLGFLFLSLCCCVLLVVKDLCRSLRVCKCLFWLYRLLAEIVSTEMSLICARFLLYRFCWLQWKNVCTGMRSTNGNDCKSFEVRQKPEIGIRTEANFLCCVTFLRILLTFLISYASWVLATIMLECLFCIWIWYRYNMAIQFVFVDYFLCNLMDGYFRINKSWRNLRTGSWVASLGTWIWGLLHPSFVVQFL